MYQVQVGINEHGVPEIMCWTDNYEFMSEKQEDGSWDRPENINLNAVVVNIETTKRFKRTDIGMVCPPGETEYLPGERIDWFDIRDSLNKLI